MSDVKKWYQKKRFLVPIVLGAGLLIGSQSVTNTSLPLSYT